jgi:hypothetical protein
MNDEYIVPVIKRPTFDMHVKKIDSKQAYDLILNTHYAHRLPSISFAYGLFEGDELIGCCTFGSPASPSLVKGVCGGQFKKEVIELNRLVLKYNRKNEASFLVAKSLALLPKPRVVISYADTAQGHTGIVYQATNFLFTGTSKPRTDIDTGEKHSRHYEGITDYSKRKPRSAKHRYITFLGSKTERKRMMQALKYGVLPYPKTQEAQQPASGQLSVQVSMRSCIRS